MLIDYLYENVKKEILKGFINPIEIKEILFFYRKYLEERYLEITEKEEFELKKEKFLKREMRNWIDVSKKDKQRFLVYDENLTKLGYFSNLAYEAAMARIKGENVNITEETAQNYKKRMKEYASKVRNFNIEVAKEYLSNGIVDIDFACGKTECTSFRVVKIR